MCVCVRARARVCVFCFSSSVCRSATWSIGFRSGFRGCISGLMVLRFQVSGFGDMYGGDVLHEGLATRRS